MENRLAWIDYLRASATFGVILIHVSGVILYQYGTLSDFEWWTGNLMDSAVRWAVPVFAMLTGALMLPYNYSMDHFYKKRLLRLLAPFIFWAFIYVAFNLLSGINHHHISNYGEAGALVWISITKGISPHFWFIYLLIGLYLLIPVLRRFIFITGENGILIFLSFWILYLFIRLAFLSTLIPDNYFTYLAGFLGYPLLGYYLLVKEYKKRSALVTIALLMILTGIAFTAFGTAFLSSRAGKFVDDLYEYLTPNVLLSSLGIFLLFKTLEENKKQPASIVRLISKYSYGIYLVHILIIALLGEAGMNWNIINPYIGIPSTALLCLGISVAVIHGLNRLPFGKYISG